MKRILQLLVLTTLLSGMVSCKKYEDGPSVSLLTKKSRLCNDWKVTEYLINGTAQNLSGGEISLSIEKDGSYTSVYSAGSFSFTDKGKWEFSGDKEKVTFTPATAGSNPSTSDILELRNKQLKLKQVDGTYTEIITYEAK